ncbi:MAG: hypothetical protein CFH33_01383 [Alphaproteobacteria bacterium MarineAlpha9_Bin3]|nr:MAG: hypothetical protein CFH33_01383 [Alphaproteobacteria bacterium MarineAlpha9_Bin3]
MIKKIGIWILRIVLAATLVVAGNIGLYYIWVFVF